MSVDSITRVERIRAELEGHGRVRVADLAAELGVSEMTVRRDLDTLAEQGVVQRVRGGAVALGPQPFAERYGHAARAKDRIAAKLLRLVDDGGAIGIDASTTLLRLAARLDGVRNVTVVTNSVESFAVLNGHAGVTGLLTGGQHDPRTGSLVGPLATRAAGDVLLGRLFISAAGVDLAFGTTEATLEEAEVKQALAASAAEIVVAVDGSKLDQRGAARCLPPERIDVLVTDLDPRDARLRPWRSHCRVL
jgi:DeoR family fructose operon transcriptional repressor